MRLGIADRGSPPTPSPSSEGPESELPVEVVKCGDAEGGRFMLFFYKLKASVHPRMRTPIHTLRRCASCSLPSPFLPPNRIPALSRHEPAHTVSHGHTIPLSHSRLLGCGD